MRFNRRLRESRDDDYYSRPPRFYTNGLMELIQDNYLDAGNVASDLANWMSEDDVERFCEVYELKDEIERNAGWDVDGDMDECLTESDGKQKLYDFLFVGREDTDIEGEELLCEEPTLEQAWKTLAKYGFTKKDLRFIEKMSVAEGEMLGLDTY